MLFSRKPFRGVQVNPAHQLARGLVGAWVMNEGSGSKVNDLSGNGCHSTSMSGSWVVTGGGAAIECNAVDEEINIDASRMPVIGTGNYTLFAGITHIETNDHAAILAINGYAPEWLISTNEQLHIYHSGFKSWTGTRSLLKNNEFHKIAYVRRSTGANGTEAWVDGKLEATCIHSNSISAPVDFVIGNNKYGDNQFVGGFVYVYFWNRDLTEEELSLLFRNPYAMFEAESPARFFYVAVGGGLSIPVAIHHYTKNIGQ